MTINGEVYMRVSGESYPVEDPATLRRLFERGEGRAGQAEAEALFAASVPDNEAELDDENPYLRIRIAFAPTGRADDIGGTLFTQRFWAKLATAADRLPPSPLFPYGEHYREFVSRTTQDSVIVSERHEDNRQRWTLRARWDGSVAAFLDLRPRAEDAPRLYAEEIFGASIQPAAHAVASLVADLGGYGRAHVALTFHARRFEVLSINNNQGRIPGPETLRPIQAWTTADGVLEDETLDRMRRELLRASGAIVWEPEPQPEGEAQQA
jgi:hypothetical protein